MEIQKSATKAYGFTLKRTTKPSEATEEMYMKHIKRLPWWTPSNVVFEKQGGLHSHGVAYIAKGIDKKRFTFRGWHIHLVELYDPQQWDLYLNKNQETLPIDVQTLSEDNDSDFKMPTKRIIPIHSQTSPPFKPVAGGCKPGVQPLIRTRGYYPYDPRSWEDPILE